MLELNKKFWVITSLVFLVAVTLVTASELREQAMFTSSSFAKCDPHTPCGTGTVTEVRELPVHVALRLREDWKELRLSLHSGAGHEVVTTVTLKSEEKAEMHCNEKEYDIVHISDHAGGDITDGSCHLPSLVSVLPREEWFSLTACRDENDDAVQFVLQSQSKGSGESFVTSVLSVTPSSGDLNISAVSCSSFEVIADLKCLEGSDVGHSKSLLRSVPTSSTPRNKASPAPNVVWAVTVCTLFIAVFAVLFGLWHWQRKKLSRRRNSYQHQVLKRQQSDHRDPQNCLELRQADNDNQSNFRQVSVQENDDNKRLSLMQQDKSSRKPRTFVRPARSDSHCSSQDSNTTSNTSVGAEVCNPIYVNVPINANSDSRDLPISSTQERSSEPCTPEEDMVRRLSDDGGVTGPYWFHSNRQPDPKTSLKIFRV